MSNQYFRFKQFTIWHDQCAMRVNTDGVLLGSWTIVNNPGYILDIGTGTGLLALMLAQRCNAPVDAVEIETNAWKQAKYNVEQSDWVNRIEVILNDFCNYYKTCSKRYDLIVSNPPYFSNSLKNNNAHKTLARHNDSLPFDCLLQGVNTLLTAGGTFAVILPANSRDFEDEAFIYGLKCSRRMLVRSLPGKEAIRYLIEFKRDIEIPCKEEDLTIYDTPGVYSAQYIELTREYYLNRD